MSDPCGITNIDDNSSLYEILKHCANFQSCESLPFEDFNDVYFFTDYDNSSSIYLNNCAKMMSANQYSVSGNLSSSSYTSEDSLGDNIVEENGRISLAYENLKTIPRRMAEKFALQAKFLDLSYNNFQNLSFLAFFEDLHTLILDRNPKLDVLTLPFLQNLKILWINNCDIENVFDWIYRIRTQCPSLEYLSIMGNPGIKEPYGNFSNVDSIVMPGNNFSDQREFILQMLPHLQYLNGIPRNNILKAYHYTSSELSQSTTCSSASPPNSIETGSTSQSQHCNGHANRKVSPSLSFKTLFLLKRRKKSYPSSSTN